MIEVNGIKTKVIDCHNHWGLDKSGGGAEPDLEEYHKLLGGIDKTFLFPSNHPVAGPRGFTVAEKILDIAKNSNQILPFFRLDLAEVDRCKFHNLLCSGGDECRFGEQYGLCEMGLEDLLILVKKIGFKGVKIHPRTSMKNYRVHKIDSPELKRVVLACDKAGLKMVSIHTHNFEMVSEFVELGKSTLPSASNVALICGHSGGGTSKAERRICREYVGRQITRIRREYSWANRMLFDMSNVYEEYLLEGLLLCKRGADGLERSEEGAGNISNLVYGTDWPFVKDITPGKKVEKVISTLSGAGFSEKEIHALCHKNIEKVL